MQPFTQIYGGGISLPPIGMVLASSLAFAPTMRSIQMRQGLGAAEQFLTPSGCNSSMV